ncbi:MAG: hypothetical protein ACK4GL_03005 [Flavobacteriales bacterium]
MGISNAYSFSPSSLQFNPDFQPTLSISYQMEELEGYPLEILWIINQINDGSWKGNLLSAVNTTQNNVSVKMPHFSDWGMGRFLSLNLIPDNPAVEVNKKVKLFVTGFKKTWTSSGSYSATVALYTLNADEKTEYELLHTHSSLTQ